MTLVERAEAVGFRVTQIQVDLFRVDGEQFHGLVDEHYLTQIVELNEGKK